MADDIEGGGPPPEEASNRTFLIAAASLGGLFLVGLACIGVYAFFIAPGVAERRAAEAATINAQNTAVAMALAQTQTAGGFTPTPPPPVTNTPVVQIQPSLTPTLVPSETATVGPSPTASPTLNSATLTAQAGRTLTRTPTPTGLPETGFADEAGIPAMVTAGVLLIGVLVVARTLRLSNAN